MTREIMPVWVVFDCRGDYPNCFVARRWLIVAMGQFVMTDDVRTGVTIEELRGQLPPGLYRLPPRSADDQNILEVWL